MSGDVSRITNATLEDKARAFEWLRARALDPENEHALYAAILLNELATVPLRVVHYERRPELDKRVARGDDFAGDAWVRWVAPGHKPSDARE